MKAKQATPSNASAAASSGPIVSLLVLSITVVLSIGFSWLVAVLIEMVGSYTLWRDKGVMHGRDLVIEDLGYIRAAPSSLLVQDTVAFSEALVAFVTVPFTALGVIDYHQRVQRESVGPSDAGKTKNATLMRVSRTANMFFANVGLAAMYCAQDIVLRLAIVIFSIPAFVLACLLGAVDGLVRRDLRKWGGGRESSFIYHNAKATTYLALGGGFSLYLAWPFGGFNPAYMVLVFTFLVAWFLSLTLSSFKKYL